MEQFHHMGGAATPDGAASMAPGGYGPPPGGGYGPPGGGYGPPGTPGAPGGYGPPPGGYGPPPGQPPAGYGPAPAMPQQPPMPQPGAPGAAPKKGGAGMKVGLALLGVAVVGGGIAAAVMFLGGGGALPFDAGHLPPKTESIRSGNFKTYVGLRSMLRIDDVPEEATWSTLSAQACGGHDVFGELMSAALGDVEDAITALTRDEKRYQEALACGKTLAGELSSRAGFYSVGFRKGDDYHSVDLLPLGVEKLPDSVDTFGTKSDPSNMTETHCKLPWPPKKQKGDKKKSDDDKDEKPTCEDHTPAIARLEGMEVWATGGLQDLKEFGSKFSPKGENKSDVEPLSKIAGEVKGYDERRVGTGKSFPSISSVLGVRVSAFDAEETKELNEVAEKGIEAWALGKKGHFGAGELKIVIVAKSDSRAKDIEGKIKDYLSMIKEKLEEAEKEEEKAKKDKKKSKDDDKDERLVDFVEARTEIARRTLDDLVMTRDDVRIVIEVVEKVDGGQQSKIDAFLDWRKEKGVVAAKVVRSLLEGEEPSDEDLESLHADIAGAMKWHKKWPHEPRYAKDGFYVPGNGNFDVKIENSEILEVYEYDLPRKDLIELVKFLNEKKGWKLKKGSGDEYTAKKDGSELKLTFREENKKGTIVLGK
jgi:hypothetical protein